MSVGLSAAVLAVKLVGVGGIVLGATLLARRHGHRAGGLVGGLPLIAGTVTGLLLLTQPADAVRAVAVATLACVPATVLHQIVFAWMARRHGAARCSLAANGVFAGVAAVLGAWVGHPAVAIGLALAAVVAAGALLGRWAEAARSAAEIAAESAAMTTAPVSPVATAATARPDDLPWRVGAAVLLAALLLVAAERAPPAVGGWLLALPIVGNVLPVFTLRRDGIAATQALLRGFVSGFGAFVGFFALLVLGLPMANGPGTQASGAALPAMLVFGLAVLCAPVVGLGLARWVRRLSGGTLAPLPGVGARRG